MTGSDPSTEDVQLASAAAFDELYKSGAELDVALDYWDANVRSLIEAALDRVELINTPEDSGLRKHTAAQLKAELVLLPLRGEPLIPGYAKVNISLRVWLEIVQARVVEMMQVVVDMGAEQIYDRFFGVLIDALLEEEQNPEQAKRENHTKLDAALVTAKETLAILSAPVEVYTGLMGGAASAVSEIADTLHEAAGLLVAQLNLLGEFLNQTDPQPEQSEPTVSRGRIGKTLFKLGIKEGAIETGKEVATEMGKEFLKEVAKPVTFGLSILLGMGLSMREKKKALAEKREELERQAELLRAEPRPENYMHALKTDLQSGNKLIINLIKEIDDFTNQLHASLVE